jgi:uncharacterized membrane protein SpoIIM required for sporulation
MESGSGMERSQDERHGVLQALVGGRLTFFGVLFVLELVVFVALPSFPFMQGEQQSYTQQAQQLGNLLSGRTFLEQTWVVFSNNLRVALVEMLPGLGAIIFGASLYDTARITQAIALNQNLPASLLVLLLFTLPHSWIELSAYPVATGEGILFLNSLLRWLLREEKWRMGAELRHLALAIGLVAAILLVAAVFEVEEIQLGLQGFVLWGPFGVLAAIILVLRHRILRARKEKEFPFVSDTTAPLSSLLRVTGKRCE